MGSSYCYNSADQVTSTTAANHSGIGYDTDGNTTTVGPDTLTYDGDNRNLTITSTGPGGGNPIAWQATAK